ncbi:MAG: lipopolysaccharide kinase InaA family protein [Opitutales bacterium]
MPFTRSDLSRATDALRRDPACLSSVGVDPARLRDRSRVFEVDFPENSATTPAYLKIYSYQKHILQRLWRPGRSRREARNLLFFRSLDIPAPRVLAWGQKRNALGKRLYEFIVTETIPAAQPLPECIREHCPDRSNDLFCERRDAIIKTLAQRTRLIHARHFFHRDLKWRNILARPCNEQTELFWIDCPVGAFRSLSPVKRHHIIKDCATLDIPASLYCTREERMYFIACYLDCAPEDPKVRTFARQVENYRKRRFERKNKEGAPRTP